jgi:hypothetical protein
MPAHRENADGERSLLGTQCDSVLPTVLPPDERPSKPVSGASYCRTDIQLMPEVLVLRRADANEWALPTLLSLMADQRWPHSVLAPRP